MLSLLNQLVNSSIVDRNATDRKRKLMMDLFFILFLKLTFNKDMTNRDNKLLRDTNTMSTRTSMLLYINLMAKLLIVTETKVKLLTTKLIFL